MSVHKNSRFGEAFTKADLHFRLGFAQLLEAGMKAADDPNTALLDSRLKLKYSLRQGNAAAIRDSSKGAGWIDEPYAAALFEELEYPTLANWLTLTSRSKKPWKARPKNVPR
jgi:hypothetical protein